MSDKMIRAGNIVTQKEDGLITLYMVSTCKGSMHGKKIPIACMTAEADAMMPNLFAEWRALIEKHLCASLNAFIQDVATETGGQYKAFVAGEEDLN